MARILYVSTSTTIGGAEKTLYTLASGLGGGHRAAGVVSLKPEGHYARELRAKGIQVESLGVVRAGLSDAASLARIIERVKPDVVHAFMYQAIQLCRLAKPKAAVPFKLVSSPRVHYRTRSWPTLLLDRALKGRDDLLIAESDSSRNYLVGRLGYAPGKVRIIRNGIEPAASASPADRAEFRAKMGARDGDILIGAAGRLDEQKGFSYLIEAMGRVKDERAKCVILGEGPERSRLEASTRGTRVKLAGERPGAAAQLSAFDVFCLPSLWEGLPNVLLEAMSLGVPVVASAVDGVPEIVDDGKTGLLVPPASPDALAAALESLSGDPARRAALGAAGRAIVLERFSLRRMLDEYAGAYTSVTAF